MGVQELLDEIKRIDIEPGIFKVFLMAAGHMTGYRAWVSFRTYSKSLDWMSECHARGDTPEQALQRLYTILMRVSQVTCPHCGETLDTENEE